MLFRMLYFFVCLLTINAGTNYSHLGDDIVNNIISQVQPAYLDNVRRINQDHHRLTEDYYAKDISQLLHLTSQSVYQRNSNLAPGIESIMLRHQNDSRFNQLLHAKFPFILRDIKGLCLIDEKKMLLALGIDIHDIVGANAVCSNTALDALYHTSRFLAVRYHLSSGYYTFSGYTFSFMVNSFLYKALRGKLNVSNSELIPGTILWKKQYVHAMEVAVIVGHNDLTATRDLLEFLSHFRPLNVFCSVWNQCIFDIINVFEVTNPNASLSFDGRSVFYWLQITTKVAYYNYQRGDAAKYKQVVGALTNIFYDEANGEFKRLLFHLRSWQQTGKCVNVFNSRIRMETTPAIQDTYFVSMMMNDLSTQRDDWETFSLAEVMRISYFARIWFGIFVLLAVLTWCIVIFMLSSIGDLLKEFCVNYLAKSMDAYIANKSWLPCGLIFMLSLIVNFMLGFFAYPMCFRMFIQFFLRKLEKCGCCMPCFKHPKLFKVVVICLSVIFGVILFVPLFIIPPL